MTVIDSLRATGYLGLLILIATVGLLGCGSSGGGSSDGGSSDGDCKSTATTNLQVADPIDPSTINDKVLFGYQGWFTAPGDGSDAGWRHWSPDVTPNGSNINVDLWPDLSEFDADELFDTDLTLPNSATAHVFSSHNKKTLMRHMRWIWEQGVDGIVLQRFVSELSFPPTFEARNNITQYIRQAAETYGRTFTIMYDVSGADPNTIVDEIKDDWTFLVDCLGVTSSPYYLKQNGRPVVSMWGFGFNHIPEQRNQAQTLISYFKQNAPANQLAFLIGGVPYWWRESINDSHPNYLDIYDQFDAVIPWSVGRYIDQPSFDNLFNNVVIADKQYADTNGLMYAPVTWPGFSWTNLMRDLNPRPPLNQIPRDGGRFFWRQAYQHGNLQPSFHYLAMFDEVDEGTALFKAAATAQDVPVEAPFVHYSIDGEMLPSNWYLRLSGAFTAGVHEQLMIDSTIPISP